MLAEQSGVWIVLAIAAGFVALAKGAHRLLSRHSPHAPPAHAAESTPAAARKEADGEQQAAAEPVPDSTLRRSALSFALLIVPFVVIEAALLLLFPLAADLHPTGRVGALLFLIPLLVFLVVARRRGALDW